MVDRYYGPLVGFEMRLGERGDYVRYSDYAALEAQLAELEAENARLRNLSDGLHDEVQFMRQAVKENRESLSRTGAVTEAMVEAAAIAISGGRKDQWDGFDLFKRASFRTRALHALKAAMEAGG